MYLVTRHPGAPARRAGRTWPDGETTAELDEAELAVLARDPRFTVAAIEPTAPPPAAETDTAPAPAPVRKTTRGRPRKRPATDA